MYGDEGWCRGCGTPLVEQCGSLVVQASKFPTAKVWMPNWLFDVVCVAEGVAHEIDKRFTVDLGEVNKPRTGPTGVKQIRPVQTALPWYRPDELSEAVRARHRQHDGDRTGSTCGSCGRWKWLPVSEHEATLVGSALESSSDVITSPEVFGDGMKTFRHLLFRRDLGQTLVGASPRNWDLAEITIT